MNIRSIQCPSCGANLKLENVNQSIIFCQFCGASIQLETNHNKGYDMELGRLDARGELADKLLQKIEKIKPELIRNGKAERDTKYYPQAISSEKATLSVERTSGWKEAVINPLLKGLVVLAIGSFVIVSVSSIVPKPVLILLELLIGLAPVYLPVLGVVKKMQKHGKIKARIASYETALTEAQRVFNETEAYLSSNAEVDIPRKFRNENALTYFVKGLKAREFVSLDQAIFRYEETTGTADKDYDF
ncbi:MAG: hypothetical protein IK007_00365 [Lachnospiraceae bacterium]|nr:hypothetical protein [Lachnospiraceae bacterium]